MTVQGGVYGPQKRYSNKQSELGMVKVTVWVPVDDREKTLKYATKLRKDHLKKDVV